MAIIKCKMCGGDLNLVEGVSTAECEFCGSVQTIPALDDEKKLIQFERAERLRKQCEFDKASGIYETIVADFRQEAEAYWGLVLCKYGIEYVDDPATGRKIPTCHRSSFDSVMDDSNFEQALENADSKARRVYREEAKQIEELRKGILSVSSNEQPYDIFICYKETDENGDRTLDSVLAQDIYDSLKDHGYRTFFARITLEDKLGTEYEPYIFAALNSAKIMLVVGTDYEYFNAVWVKNEWSRFLKLMTKDKGKHLIPCYKGIDAYDMPKEFAKLQAQDLGKVGAVQDLLRGVEKLVPKKELSVKETMVISQSVASSVPAAPLLKRAFMFLEDRDWNSANEYCEKVLDIDPECAQAYLGKLMADLRVTKQESLRDCKMPFDSKNNYQKVLRFADSELNQTMQGYIHHINERNEMERLEAIYNQAANAMNSAQMESDYLKAAERFESIPHHRDSTELAIRCRERAETARKDFIYEKATRQMGGDSISGYKDALKLLNEIPGWRDADKQAEICKKIIEELKVKEERLRNAKARQEELSRREQERIAKRNKKIALIALLAVVVVIVLSVFLKNVVIPESEYINAIAMMERKEYQKAEQVFEYLGEYKDSKAKAAECHYYFALELMAAGEYENAIVAFEDLGDYRDSSEKIAACRVAIADRKYSDALSLMDAGKYDEAIVAFKELRGYRDSAEKIAACNTAILDGKYDDATALMDAGKYDEAIAAFNELNNYKNCTEKISGCEYAKADMLLKAGDIAGAAISFGKLGDYQDARARSMELWEQIAHRETLSAGASITVGLRPDGTVVVAGRTDKCDVSGWRDIIAVSAGEYHIVGLKADGTVVATGYDYYGQCKVSDWKDIVAITADSRYTVGIKMDGTVVAVGRGREKSFAEDYKISDWRDIVAVSGDYSHVAALKADGTVMAYGSNNDGECDVSEWTDIVAISTGSSHTVGLKADGTVLATGSYEYAQCATTKWTDIVAISTGNIYTIGLKADGTVVATGDRYKDWLNVSGWKNIAAISAGEYGYAVGLRKDGYVIVIGENDKGACKVTSWGAIRLP